MSDLLTLAEVASQYRVSISTVSRWCTCGYQGTVLESIMIGGRRLVPQVAVEAFARAEAKPSKPRPQRRTQLAAARDLKRLRIL